MVVSLIYKNFSDEEFIEIAQSSTNIREALVKMGRSDHTINYKNFIKRCGELNISVPARYGQSASVPRQNINDNDIINSCKEGISRSGVLKYFNLDPTTNANINWINKKIKNLNIDISHWLGQGYLKGKTHNWGNEIPLEKILVEQSSYTSLNNLKKKLIKAKLLEYKCDKCGLTKWNNLPLSLQLHHKNGNGEDHRMENLQLLCPNCHYLPETHYWRSPEPKINYFKEKVINSGLIFYRCCVCGAPDDWLGSKLSLHLDHINGDRSNNNIENLRFLCPNCHSQTDTYCGRNVRNIKKRVNWPTDKELVELINNCDSYDDLAKHLGTTGQSVRNRIKNRGIIPPRKHKSIQASLPDEPKPTKTKKKHYCKCGKEITSRSDQCRECYKTCPSGAENLISWPPDEELLKLVNESGYAKTAKLINVSRQAVRSRLQTKGLIAPKKQKPKELSNISDP